MGSVCVSGNHLRYRAPPNVPSHTLLGQAEQRATRRKAPLTWDLTEAVAHLANSNDYGLIDLIRHDEVDTIPFPHCVHKLHGQRRSTYVQQHPRFSRFYAQLVEFENNQSQQIFIFWLNESGRYVLADHSKIRENTGGSGKLGGKNIVFRNSSLYVSSGYSGINAQVALKTSFGP